MDKFRQTLKRFKIKASVAAVALVIIGLLFIIFPESSANVICYVAGAFLAVWGILFLISFFSAGRAGSDSADLALGLTLVCVALVLFIKPWVVTGILTVLFGIALIVDSAVKLQSFFAMNRLKKKTAWLILAIAIVSVVLGFLLVFDPFSHDTLMIFAGVSLIVIGVMDMIALGITNDFKQKSSVNVIDLDDEDIIREEKTSDGENDKNGK